MGEQIFKNENNEVILGGSGNIFGVPYNFNRALSTSILTTMYVYVPNISFTSDNYHIIQWYNQLNPQQGIKMAVTLSGENNYDSLSVRSITSNSDQWPFIRLSGINTQSSAMPLTTYASIFFMEFIKNNFEVTPCYNLNERTSATDSNEAYEISNLYIGAYGNIVPTSYCNTYSKRADLLIYNRVLSESERKYIYNNLSGREPISLLGCVCFFKNNKAEILDFSGNDYAYDADNIPSDASFAVGVRDFSGNAHHGQIMNLPDGTLAEQLEYANANLFVNFIS